MEDGFAHPVKKLAESGIGNTVLPVGGQGLTLDTNGKLPTGLIPDSEITSAMILDGTITNADLSGGYPQISAGVAACSGDLTLTTSSQDVTGCSVSLPAGSYIVFGVMLFTIVTNGVGSCVGNLIVGGSTQSGVLQLTNTGAAIGDAATVAQTWVFTIGSTQTVKFQANKTINAGSAAVKANSTTLTYLRYL